MEEAELPGNSLSAVARKYGVNPNQLFHWRKLMRMGALVAVGADEHVVPASEERQLKVRNRAASSWLKPSHRPTVVRFLESHLS